MILKSFCERRRWVSGRLCACFVCKLFHDFRTTAYFDVVLVLLRGQSDPILSVLLAFMHSSSDRLRQQRATLRENSSSLSRTICQTARGLQHQYLSRNVAIVIWIMFSLVANPLPAILVFLKHSRGRKLAQLNDGRLTDLAEKSFLSARIDDLHDVCCNNPSHYARQWKYARRYISEQELFEWCQDVNMSKGIAPSTFALIEQAKLKAGMPRCVRMGLVSGAVSPAARVWALSWRKRWRARLGVLRQGEQVSSEHARQKVSIL